VKIRPSTVDKIAHLANSIDRASNTVCGEPYSTSEQLFQLLQVSGKGHGLVASQSIKRGTCIIEETPIVRLQPTTSEQESGMALARQLSELSSEKATTIDELYYDPRKVDPRLLQDFRSTGIRMAIFHTNSISMGDAGQYGTGLFPLFSRLNHSCNANVHHSFNVTTGKETVYAVVKSTKERSL